MGKKNVLAHGFVKFVMDGGKYDTARYSANSKLAAKLHSLGAYSPAADAYITYRHLPPGKHRLQAKLVNNDGSAIGPSAVLAFTVK